LLAKLAAQLEADKTASPTQAYVPPIGEPAAPKPARKPRKAKPAADVKLNAIGKPYSPQYDPKYRMKHKPARYVTGTAGRSSAASLRNAKLNYRWAIEAKHAGNPDLIKEICERNGA
jgi:hypothetical protein